jgi:hypothetical protein
MSSHNIPEKTQLSRQPLCPPQPLDISDDLIEVMAVGGSLHMAAIHSELYTAHRLAQCAALTIEARHAIHMQVDGEPWLQPGPSKVC